MKLKKFLAVLLALTCMVGLFVGCTDETDSSGKKKPNTNTQSSNPALDDDDWTKNY